jgi:hypothetical protein
MLARPQPGLAFSLVSDVGFGVGLVTHDIPKTGSLIWIAESTFEEEPTLELVRQISEWRWPVLFPLAAAIRRKIVQPIGMIPVPRALQPFPTMRSGNKTLGWTAFTESEGVRRKLGSTNDRSLPIYGIVNDTRLKEMIVSGWRPEDEW